MKRRKIIIAIILIIVILIVAFFIMKALKSQSREYTIEKVENYDYFVLQENDQYGVIDKDANIVIEPKFEEVVIPNPSKAIFVCTTENKEIKVYNEKNEEQFTNYDEVKAIRLKNVTSDLMYEKSVLRYKKDGKYGLIDYTGKQVTDAIYGNVEGFEYKEGELLVEQNGQYGVINIRGNEMIPLKYQIIHADKYYSEENGYREDGYIVGVKTSEGFRYGYIDIDGEEVLKTEYNDISRITNLDDIYLIAAKNGQYGVYKRDKQILKNEYQSIDYDSENKLFLLEKSKKYGIANIEGDIILDVKYSQIDVNGKYLYTTQKDGTKAVFDVNGNVADIDENTWKFDVADGKYTIVITNSDNKSLYSVQDEKENEIVKPEYLYISYLSDNYFVAADEEGKLGVIDDQGTKKIEFNYNSINKIDNTSLIQAVNEETTEIYTKTIEKICELNNAKVEHIEEYIKVYNDTESIYINKDGKTVENVDMKQSTPPDTLGDYKKIVYGNGEIYYTKK